MTRAYYTDPLKAAWMQIRFGMKFSANLPELPDAYLRPFDAMHHFEQKGLHDAVCITCTDPDDRFYIYPDSIPLLRPRPGDVMRWGDAVFVYGESPPRHLPEWHKEISIIQRNGEAFHWRKFEAESGAE